jgi:hypothetical protein
MSKSYTIKRLTEEILHLKTENDGLKMERQEMGASIARLKRELSESRMRQADLAERANSQGIHIL